MYDVIPQKRDALQRYLSPKLHICVIMKNTRMCNVETMNLSFRVTSDELAKIDRAWRSDMRFKNRADYVRSKLGLKQENEV